MDKPKIILVRLYDDDPSDLIPLLDEGQDFAKLLLEFNIQDIAMMRRQDDPECKDPEEGWLGFTDFMESKGVKVLDRNVMRLEAFYPKEKPE